MSTSMQLLVLWLHTRVSRDDRGDVPGWVLITFMTAAIVVTIWGVAGTQLQAIFSSALNNVTSSVGGGK